MRKISFFAVLLVILFSPSPVDAAPFSCQTWESTAILRQSGDGWTIGKKKLLVYRVKFSDTTEEIVTEDTVEQLLTEVNDSFTRMSYDQFSLEWIISPILELSRETDYYRNQGFFTIITEARTVALALGLDHNQFNLDVVHCPTLLGLPSGQANINDKGAMVQASLASLYLHELGHNLGLFHANAWENTKPPVTPRSSPPYPDDIASYSEPFVFDPANLGGNGDPRSPGYTVEYGDPFDLMGGGFGDFNASFKLRVKWLAAANIQRVNSSGVYRIYAHDQGNVSPERVYGLRLDPLLQSRGQNFSMRYWISFRSVTPPEGNVPLGVELHWIEEGESYVSNFLDTQPGTSRQMFDAPLALGRTYEEPEAKLFITPISMGSTDRSLYIDVHVAFGTPEGNRAPTVQLSSDKSSAAPDEPINFSVEANDPDGDSLSYYWIFGDDTYGAGPSISKAWQFDGQHSVMCEVSDGKGGKTIRRIPVTIGSVERYKVEGRITTADGTPLPGVRVHNGRIDGEFGIMPDFAATYTDSDGAYSLPNLPAGKYHIGAAVYGHELERSGPPGAVIVEKDISNLDFIARELPTIVVSSTVATVKEGESATITFTRTGPIEKELPLEFAVNGTAGLGADIKPFNTQLLTIPPGSASTSITLEALPDLDEEGFEQVTITALPASNFKRLIADEAGTREVTFHYAGWEPVTDEFGILWFQTSPSFRREAASATTVQIEDGTTPGLQRVFVVSENGQALERPMQPGNFRFERIGSTALPLTIEFTLAGTAENGIDYEQLHHSVVIPAGTNSVFLYLYPLSDEILEDVETVELTLSPSPAYTIIEPPASTVYLVEDEYNSAPNRLSFSTQWGGGTVISMKGEHGKTYVLESSVNLRDWTPESTNEVFFSPVSISIPLFVDEHRFYRSVEVLP